MDCGADAHAHVARCNAKPAGSGALFAALEEVEAAQRGRRSALLREYLEGLARETRKGVERSLRALLDDRLPGWSHPAGAGRVLAARVVGPRRAALE